MEYVDFKVLITIRYEKRRHRVFVDSPVGEFVASFVNPITPKKLDMILARNGLRVTSAENTRSGPTLEEALKEQNVGPLSSTDELDEIGKELYRALFKGPVLEAYSRTMGATGDKKGIRIRIRIDQRIPEYTELMSLPWEFLYDPDESMPIELSPDRIIVRHPIVSKAPLEPLEIERPFRVLVVVSEPDNYPKLPLVGTELRNFLVTGKQDIQPVAPQKSTIREFRTELREQECHIFHFMGHGGVTDQEVVLIFETDSRQGDPVKGQNLNVNLANARRRSVRLVFLNACDTARIPGADPFAAIPTQLLSGGIPAVVAMQFPISDKAAKEFCDKFYEGLVQGLPIDQCTSEARLQVFNSKQKAEWATPVLFMNSSDGIIFKTRQQLKGEKNRGVN